MPTDQNLNVMPKLFLLFSYYSVARCLRLFYMSKKKVLECSFRVILIKVYIISHNTVKLQCLCWPLFVYAIAFHNPVYSLQQFKQVNAQ